MSQVGRPYEFANELSPNSLASHTRDEERRFFYAAEKPALPVMEANRKLSHAETSLVGKALDTDEQVSALPSLARGRKKRLIHPAEKSVHSAAESNHRLLLLEDEHRAGHSATEEENLTGIDDCSEGSGDFPRMPDTGFYKRGLLDDGQVGTDNEVGAFKSYSTFRHLTPDSQNHMLSTSLHLAYQASQLIPSITLTSYSALSMARRHGSYVNSVNTPLSQRWASIAVGSTQKSVLLTLIEKVSSDRGATVLLAIWNILPLLQGSSIFSMPYAVAVGGYLILPAILIMSLLADVTGGILIDCLYEVSPRSKVRKRARLDYVDVARSVWGNHGTRLMNVVLVVYLFSGASVNILLIGKSVHAVLKPYTTLSFVALTSIFSIACYPTLFIRRLTIVAYLSMLSVGSIVTGIITVVCVFIMNYGSWSENAAHIPIVNPEGFPLGLSIVLFSCMCHSVLPQIEGNMAEPSKFPRALHTSYGISSVMKTLVGVLGALTYGVLAQSLVTLNVSEFNLAARIVCSIALTGFGIFNYPLSMFVVGNTCDAFVENTRFGQDGRLYFLWFASTRLVLTILSVVVALVLPYFGILLAVRGSLIGTCIIFVFPCYFQLRLKWKTLTKFQKCRNISLMVIGITIGSFGLYSSLSRLVKAIRGEA